MGSEMCIRDSICTYLYTIGTPSEHMAVSHLFALLKKAYQHTFGAPRGEEGRWFLTGGSSGPFVSGPRGKACFGPPLLSHGGEDERPKSDPGSDQERPKSRRSEAQRRFWPRRRALPAFRKYVTGTQSKRETAIYNVYMNVHICTLFVHICTYLYTIGTPSEHMLSLIHI